MPGADLVEAPPSDGRKACLYGRLNRILAALMPRDQRIAMRIVEAFAAELVKRRVILCAHGFPHGAWIGLPHFSMTLGAIHRGATQSPLVGAAEAPTSVFHRLSARQVEGAVNQMA